jgi:hypothetical protein
VIVARQDVLDAQPEEARPLRRGLPPDLDGGLRRVRQEDGLTRAAGGFDPRDGPVVLAEELEPLVANPEPSGWRRALEGQLERDAAVAEPRALDLGAAGSARDVAGSHDDPASQLGGDALHGGRVAVSRRGQQAGGLRGKLAGNDGQPVAHGRARDIERREPRAGRMSLGLK